MADLTDRQGIGDEQLARVTESMVALHERYHGRKPASARTELMGEDLIACILGEVYTDVEKTMIELQCQGMVHETRSTFQGAMEQRFIRAVEEATGRSVVKFISAHNVGPDLELEIFLLNPRQDA